MRHQQRKPVFYVPHSFPLAFHPIFYCSSSSVHSQNTGYLEQLSPEHRTRTYTHVRKSLALKIFVSAADEASSAGFWAHFNIVTYLLTYLYMHTNNSCFFITGTFQHLYKTFLLKTHPDLRSTGCRFDCWPPRFQATCTLGQSFTVTRTCVCHQAV